jgi:hypothetical protein
MKEILVDTNVLVSFLTDRNANQQEQSARLFQGASARDPALYIRSMGLFELWEMARLYEVEPEKAAKLLGSFLEMPGFETVARPPVVCHFMAASGGRPRPVGAPRLRCAPRQDHSRRLAPHRTIAFAPRRDGAGRCTTSFEHIGEATGRCTTRLAHRGRVAVALHHQACTHGHSSGARRHQA